MKKIFIVLPCLMALASCIKNDVPYPTVVPHILSVEVDGAKKVDIDMDKHSVDILLDEVVDLKKVRISKAEIDEKMTKLSSDIIGVHDLRTAKEFTLSTYQDYKWVFTASRPIERYFTIAGQIGSTVIDEANHRAIAYVDSSTVRLDMNVTSLKLGPRDVTTYSKSRSELRDFSQEVEVEVNYFGEKELWKLYVDFTDVNVRMDKINPWTKEVMLDATGVAGKVNGFRIRKKGTQQWKDIKDSDISTSGGAFSAHIYELEPETTYEVLAFSGKDETDVYEFTTDPARQLPNHSFETVSKVTGQEYYKWFDPTSSDPECRQIWWASGNGEGPDGLRGTASLGIVLTVPDSDAADGSLSARAQSSQLAGVLACGNLFTGQFTQIIGSTAGAVHYGRPWNTRPKALRLSYKYKGGLVDCVDDYPPDDVVKKGDKDRFQIFVGVGDWDYRTYGGDANSPVRVSTAKNERHTLFTPASPGIIACANMVSSQDVENWTEVVLPLEYRSYDRLPTHIIIICAVNYRGDYMTGCSSAKLWLDNFRLEY